MVVFYLKYESLTSIHHISGVMVSMLATSVIDRGFKSRSGQTIDYKIGICCFSAKHAELTSKRKRLVYSESE